MTTAPTPSTRTQKVDVLVIGSGWAAALLAFWLAAAQRKVALIVEEPTPLLPLAEFPWWHPPGPAQRWAAAGLALLTQSPSSPRAPWSPDSITLLEAALHGVQAQEAMLTAARADDAHRALIREGAEGQPYLQGALLDLPAILPALHHEIETQGGSVIPTRVRGLSVIEGRVLGAITEAGRWDARQAVVNASSAARAAALSRMARDNIPLTTTAVPLTHLPTAPTLTPIATPDGHAAWPTGDGGLIMLGTLPHLAPAGAGERLGVVARTPADAPLVMQPGSAQGLWHLLGTDGWPLLALGAAHHLATEALALPRQPASP